MLQGLPRDGNHHVARASRYAAALLVLTGSPVERFVLEHSGAGTPAYRTPGPPPDGAVERQRERVIAERAADTDQAGR